MKSTIKKVKDIINPSVTYLVENNVFRFIFDEDKRPLTPKYLSQEMYELYPDTKNFVLQKQNSRLSSINNNEHFEQKYLDFVQNTIGIIVDIATGPSGGYTHGILNSMPKDTVLISTDACTFCINSYSEFYIDKNYYYFDVDLDNPLPFNDNSIDTFTGVLLCNVSNYRGLLFEIARCLKTSGKAVFEEVFYSPESETCKYLSNKNAVYASSEIYIDYCESIGLDLISIDICRKSVGKVEPGDGMPLSETDEWYRKNIYLKKKS
jgi:SAM-dependent methyltransferase